MWGIFFLRIFLQDAGGCGIFAGVNVLCVMKNQSFDIGHLILILLVLGCSLASGLVCFLIGRMVRTVIL